MATAVFDEVNEVKDALDARKKRQAFYTPLSLVEKLVEWADVWSAARVLEPSAGDGRIVHAIRTAGVERVEACEVEPTMHARIAAVGGEVVGSDFLKFNPGAVYDRIIMNPPFRGKACDKHIEHAWSLLRDGGKLFSIAPPMTGDRLNRCELKLPGCEHATFSEVGEGHFKEYGTNIRVILVELEKGKSGEVQGFSNLATFQAALAAANDYGIYQQAMSGQTAGLMDAARQLVKEFGGSMYGVDWQEVSDHLRQEWELDPVPEEKPRPAGEQRTLFDAEV